MQPIPPRLWFGVLLLSLLVLTLTLTPWSVRANPPSPLGSAYDIIEYSGGIASDGAGIAGVIATDLTGDGEMEVLSCGTSAPYAVRATGNLQHQTAWYGERLGCTALAVADSDGDGNQEIYVGSEDAVVYIHTWDGERYSRTGALNLPATDGVTALAVANVDSDAGLEYVVVRANDTLIYDVATQTLEWDAPYGGNDVGVGNVDTNPNPEVVVNSAGDGYILRPDTQTLVLTFAGGFGNGIDVGDSDNDGIDEIAYYTSNRLYVWQADTQAVKWDIAVGSISAIRVAETNAALPGKEVIIGTNTYLGRVRGYNGNTGAFLWNITHTGNGTFGLDAADTDDDGVVEVWFGCGRAGGWDDSLVAGNSVTGATEFVALDQDAPMLVAGGDIDNDGTVELLGATYGTHEERYGADILVYDSADRYREEKRIGTYVYNSEVGVGTNKVLVGQLDGDAALEVVAAGHRYSGGTAQVRVYDGATGTQQFSYALAGASIQTIHIQNIDGDAVDEVLIPTSDKRLTIYNGATNTIDWQSAVLDFAIQDIAVGDVDGDNALEVALVTSQSLYLFGVGTWTIEHQVSLATDGFTPTDLAIHNNDGTGAGELIVSSLNGANADATRLQAFNGADYTLLWDEILSDAVANDLLVADVDEDGVGEIILGGTQEDGTDAEQATLLWVAGYDTNGVTVEYNSETGYWGNIQHLALVDMDEDGTDELLFASQDIIQVRGLTNEPPITPTPSPTGTQSPTATATVTNTPTITPTPSNTPTVTPTPTLVPNAPDAYTNPTALNEFHGNVDLVTTQTLTIGNGGELGLDWTLGEANTPSLGDSCASPSDIPWLAVSPVAGSTGGGNTTPVTVTFNGTGLSIGVYSGTLCLNSNDPDNAVIAVPVELAIAVPTAIEVGSLNGSNPSYWFNRMAVITGTLLLVGTTVLYIRRRRAAD
jgi:hypothetical protein